MTNKNLTLNYMPSIPPNIYSNMKKLLDALQKSKTIQKYIKNTKGLNKTVKAIKKTIHLDTLSNQKKIIEQNASNIKKAKRERMLDEYEIQSIQHAIKNKNINKEFKTNMKNLKKTFHSHTYHYLVHGKMLVHFHLEDKPVWKSYVIQLPSNNKNFGSNNDKKVLNEKIYAIYQTYECEIVQIEPPQSVTLLHVIDKFNQKIGEKTMAYKLLEDLNGKKEVVVKDKLCVLRYIVERCTDRPRFKYFNMKVLKEQLTKINVNFLTGVTMKEFELWITTFYPNLISFYALDPTLRVFHQYNDGYINGDRNTLVFIINNSHLYPVTNDEMIQTVVKSKKIKLQNIKWEVNSDKYLKINKYVDSPDPVDNKTPWTHEYCQLLEGKYGDKSNIILVEDIPVENIARDIINKTGYMLTGMDIKKSQIVAIQHPISGHVIETCSNYSEIKFLCDKLYKMYPYECFKYANQTYSALATSLFEVKYGFIKKSEHIVEDQKIIDEFNTVPLIKTNFENYKYNSFCKGFDISKSYATAVMNMSENYPVFSICDSFVKYNGEDIIIGEYLVDEFAIWPLGFVYFKKQILSHNIVKYLLKNNYLDKSQILLVKKASYHINYNILANFIKDLRILFPNNSDINNLRFKSMSLCFIGSFGKRYNTKDSGFVTNSYDSVCISFHENKPEEWSYVFR